MARTPNWAGRFELFDYATYSYLTGGASATELVLVRHGHQDLPPTDKPVEDRLNPPLSSIGKRQAEALGARLANTRVDVIYSSDLLRAEETARAVAVHHAVEHVVLPELREIGVFSRVPRGVSLEERFGPLMLSGMRERMMFEKSWDVFPEGETGAEFRQRTVSALEGIATSHGSSRVVVVCHGGVINAYFAHHLGISVDMFFRPAHTAINVMMAGEHGVRAVRTIGDVYHLEGTPELLTY